MLKGKPFIKFAGGKTQLLEVLINHLPKDFYKKEITYIEPFIGGGAMLFEMLHNFNNIKKAIINDINTDVVNCYRVIKNNPRELIESLKKTQEMYFNSSEEDKKKFYIFMRSMYNRKLFSDVENASAFIFLNKTCFNGLYRVNKKGEFNVPFGRYKNPKICDEETILNDSELLKNVEIINCDFSKTINNINGETFFYLDPPYKPLNKTSSFNTYTQFGFDDDEQIRLKNFCDQINSNDNCYFLLSNSDPKNINENCNFFDDLYCEYNIKRIEATRVINSKSNKRGKINELLIYNYET